MTDPPIPVERNLFGAQMNSYGFTVGIEVGGVSSADFAHITLRQWPLCEKYILVDPYRSVSDYVDQFAVIERAMDRMYNTAQSKLAEFGSVPVWMRMTNQEAAAGGLILDESADYIYIDSHQNYCALLEDLELYWPKLKVGGVMSGRLYVKNAQMQALNQVWLDWSRCDDSRVPNGLIAFAQRHDTDVYVTSETQVFQSWAFWKTSN